MIRSVLAGALLLAACLRLAAPCRGADDLAVPRPLSVANSNALSLVATNRVVPGPEDGQIAFVTAGLLQQMHYSHRRFDNVVSSEFLDGYLDSLDPQHLHFLQSDLAQFERYRTNLDNLTLSRRGVADTTPAYEIFSRFLDRLEQRVAYADELLKTAKFDFTSDERITVDRHDLPNPKDLDEAKSLWRQRLRYEYLQEKLALESAAKAAESAPTNGAKPMDQQIVETLTHRYHRTLRLFTDWNNEDVMGVYLTALAHVYDPHSDYFNKAQLDTFAISMNLQLFGIGAELLSEDGYCKIQRLLPGGPAAKSGKIHDNDRIVAVAQSNSPPVDVVDMSLTKVVQMIRGTKGTEVRLTIMPAGSSSERRVISLIRDEIPLDEQAAKGKIIDLPTANGSGTVRVGVIDLPSFYATMDLGRPKPIEIAGENGPQKAPRSTTVDVAKLLAKFKQEKVRGVILDLRANGGGVLEEAIKLTGLFIGKGPVVQAQDSDDSRQVYDDDDPSVAYDGPLIVLTSRYSASASEIVAGALQDYGRAIIVGDSSTHGKGTVQTIQPLDSLRVFSRLADSGKQTVSPGAVKITIRKFYRVSGASTQLKGVMPDIVLPSLRNYAKDIGESSLENPVPWDTTASARYEKLNRVQPYLSELLKRSSERIATNEDFVYIREDIDWFRRKQAEKTISLNEKERLQEREDDDARRKARTEERLARKNPDTKVYEVTLKQADLPGLTLAANATATGTNSTAATPSTETKTSARDAVVDEEVWRRQAALDETEHIMADYISLLPKETSVVAAP